jgi:hypothetical protein
MRHPLIKFANVAVVAGLALGAGQAKAAPLPKMDGLSSQSTPVVNVRWYRYRYWRRPYRYYRPGPYYYRPWPYYYYGYGPYWRPHRYWYRPYWRRRYWW